MAIDLVDGRAGAPHIDGDDLGDFKAGFCGSAGYVLGTGDLLEATQDDANHVTVGVGSMIMPGSGRHVRVTSPEQVVVTSGTQGQKRRDLIVMRPDTGGTVESASLVCVRGTPVSYGTPADPAVEDGDLPLYRVELDGASASEPVAVFDVLTPMSELRAEMDELRDSVSQGEVIVPTSPGETTSMRVSFPRPMRSVPTVMLTIVSAAPDRFTPPCAEDIDEEGFTLYVQRSTANNTRVAWLAVCP